MRRNVDNNIVDISRISQVRCSYLKTNDGVWHADWFQLHQQTPLGWKLPDTSLHVFPQPLIASSSRRRLGTSASVIITITIGISATPVRITLLVLQYVSCIETRLELLVFGKLA